MPRALRALLLVAIACCLVACPTAQRPESAKPTPAEPARPARDFTKARVYQVAPEESLVRILVYSGGTFAAPGHNHVIASHHVNGKVYRARGRCTRSGFDLVMPVSHSRSIQPNCDARKGLTFHRTCPSRRSRARARTC